MSEERTYESIKADAQRLGIKVHGVKKPALAALVDEALAAEKLEAAAAETDEPAVAASEDAGQGAEDTEAADDAAPGDAAAEADTGDHVEIIRTNGHGAWWCPVCDRSNSSLMSECGGCGAVKDGDRVTVA